MEFAGYRKNKARESGACAMTPLLQANGIEKSFSGSGESGGSSRVLADIGFSLYRNEILGLVGPSGCGKSTLLRIIAGLESQTKGEIEWNIAPQNPIPHFMVFQDYSRSLFPWFTVEKQLIYARNRIRANPVSDDRIENPLRHNTGQNTQNDPIRNILRLTGLSNYANMLPNQLSGGMKQRVALARALLLNPGVLLLDEPFGSLDAYNRYQLEDYLLAILKDRDIGMILVTHDLDEAVYLCDRIIIMGEKPARILEEIAVQFPRRDQIGTKSSEQFRSIRKRIFTLIQKTGFGIDS